MGGLGRHLRGRMGGILQEVSGLEALDAVGSGMKYTYIYIYIHR